MLNEHAKELVAALRSDKYKQGRAALKSNNNQMCCLGVACDLSHVGNWDFKHYSNKATYICRDDVKSVAQELYTMSPFSMPIAVALHYGFTSTTGHFDLDDKSASILQAFVDSHPGTSPDSEAALARYKNYGIVSISLMRLNDDGVPFSVIADLIESDPPRLFGPMLLDELNNPARAVDLIDQGYLALNPDRSISMKT